MSNSKAVDTFEAISLNAAILCTYGLHEVKEYLFLSINTEVYTNHTVINAYYDYMPSVDIF